MKVAINGASGFLGKLLVKKLLKHDDVKIIAFTSIIDVFDKYDVNGKLEVHGRDSFRNRELVGVDVLINCAFPRNNDGKEMALGLKYISDFLNQAVNDGVKSVINISSQSVYSQNRTEAASEDYELCLESEYAVGKFASELLTNNICRNIRHTNIRLASLIGPDFDQRVVNKMVASAIKTNTINIVKGNQQFGYMNVDDAANALVMVVMNKDSTWENVYNLGISGGYSLEYLAESVRSILKHKDIKILKNEKTYNVNSTLICTKFFEKFKFQNYTSIIDSINQIIKKEGETIIE